MTKKLYILLFTVLAMVSGKVEGQIFPVQASTQLTPPYSLYLSDYVAPGSERLALNVFLGDVTRPSLDVRFRLRIIGQSVTLETKAEFIPPPVTLQSGVNMRLISSDLAAYFDPRNLNFTGITEGQYQRSGKLPEGVYQICFEVLEYNRGVKISNTACGVAWMVLNDPPLINLPRQNEKVRPQEPQNVVLQWTPRHTGSPNSAFSTEYVVEMVEVWPADRNPNDAILSSPKILEATTQSTTYIYGPSEVQLVAGRRYAFRVRAKAISGIDELDLFKNQGYSEVFSFVYGDACGVPGDIVAEPLSSSRIRVGWGALEKHSVFNVRYRESGTTDWYTNNVTLDEATINSLKPSTVYEYQVNGACGSVQGEFSDIRTVKTLEAPPMEYSCGLPLETFNLDPSKLTGSLKIGDIVNAGDFDVELTKVSGANGIFSGEGVVVMPMMNKVHVKVAFTNITVATDETLGVYRMVKGHMNVTGGKVDVIPIGVMNLVDKLDETLDIADSALNVIETYLPRNGPDPSSFAADSLITMDGNILMVVPNNDTGSVYVTTKDGKVTELKPGTSYAIQDSNGKGYVVDKNGNVTKTTAEEAVKASKREYNLAMKFTKSEGSPFGFDEYDGKNSQLTFTYEQLNDTYYVPYKSIEQTSADPVDAELSDKSLNPEYVRFEMIGVQGTVNALGNNKWKINITYSDHSGKIVAYYKAPDDEKEQVLGKLNVSGYAKENYNLVIIKDSDVNVDMELAGITTQLNKIYGQAAVEWKVSQQTRDLNVDKSFDAGGTSIVTNYTADMRKVISSWGDFQENTFYMFVIDKPDNSKDVGAFMPRGRQAGFVYAQGGTISDYTHDIAHELGHGAFALRHPFLEFEGLAQKSTDNLMDYNGGTHLMHFQWERIHDPVTVIGLFDEDEEAHSESVLVIPEDVRNFSEFSEIKSDDSCLGYVNAAGGIIQLPNNARMIKFYLNPTNDSNYITTGILGGFDLGGNRYFSYRKGNEFSGYKAFNGGLMYDETKYCPSKFAGKVIIGLPVEGQDCKQQLFKVKYTPSLNLIRQTNPISYNDPEPFGEIVDRPNCPPLANGPGKSFYDSYSVHIESEEDRKLVYDIGVLYNEIGGILISDFNSELWEKQKEYYKPVYQEFLTDNYDWKKYYESLVKYKARYEANIELIKQIDEKDRAPLLLAAISDRQLQTLSFDLRKQTIETFSTTSVCSRSLIWQNLETDCQKEIIRLIKTTPETEREQILNSLKQKTNGDLRPLYRVLFEDLTGSSYKEYVSLICEWTLGLKLDEFAKNASPEKILHWGHTTTQEYKQGSFMYTFSEGVLGVPAGKFFTFKMHDYSKDGKLVINYTYEYSPGGMWLEQPSFSRHHFELDPFELVGVVFLSPPDQELFPGAEMNTVYPVPAIFYLHYAEGRTSEFEKNFLWDTFQVATSALGFAYLGKVATVWQKYLLFVEFLNAADFVLKNPEIRADIIKTEAGKEFLFYFDRVVLGANVVAISPFAYKAASGFVKATYRLAEDGPRIFGQKWDQILEMAEKFRKNYKIEIDPRYLSMNFPIVKIQSLFDASVLAKIDLKVIDKVQKMGITEPMIKALNKDLKDVGESLINAFNKDADLLDSWKVFKDKGSDVLARNPDALKYLDDLKGTAKLGNDGITDFTQLKNKWDKMFPSTVNPDRTSKLVRHHAIEQQVLTKYPGVISEVEMQSINNLRGIPKDINSEVHLSAIRIEWNDFYKTFDQVGTVPTKQQLLDKATEIDNKFGHYFDPPLR